MPNTAKPFFSRFPPSAFLLAAQLLQLILYAVFDGLHTQRAFLSAFGGIVLVLVVWVVLQSPAVNWVALALGVPAFILTMLSAVLDGEVLMAWSSLLEALLYFYAAGSLIAYMMKDTQVTLDELFAAGGTFTLLAWGYAYSYMVVQAFLPGSFIDNINPGKVMSFIELLFLSFTNLSATGLSDIIPTTTAARVLIMLEQMTGVGYIAVVVSRLIGLTLQRQKNRHA